MPSSPGVETRSLVGTTLALLFAALLSACGSSPAPRLFLLEAPASSGDPLDPLNVLEPPPPLEKLALSSIGTDEVILPDYAGNDAIMTRLDNGELSVSERLRWAEPPALAMTRLFAERLRAHTTTQVVAKPWPRDYEPAIRVELHFDHVYRLPDGGASIAGRINFISGDGRLLVNVKPFREVESATDTQVQSFFNALARAIDKVSTHVYRELAEPAS